MQIIKIPKPFEAADWLVEDCLAGYTGSPNWVEIERKAVRPGAVVEFRLSHKEFGDLGKIEIKNNGQTTLVYKYPLPLPTKAYLSLEAKPEQLAESGQEAIKRYEHSQRVFQAFHSRLRHHEAMGEPTPAGEGIGDRREWLPYEERAFTLPTTPDRFADWLERHTKPRILYLSEDRKYYLSIGQFFAPRGDSKKLVITGAVSRPDPECEEAGLKSPVEGGVIAFDVLSVGNRQEEQIEVKVSCRHSAAKGVFDDLLAKIGKTWPGSVELTPGVGAGNGPFNIPLTARQFDRELKAFVERETKAPDIPWWLDEKELYVDEEGKPIRPCAPELTRWRTGPKDIRKGEDFTLTCDPFQGLTLEITRKEDDLQVVVIRPETYQEPIVEALPHTDDVIGKFNGWDAKGPIATITGHRTRQADPDGHAVLSAWLRSLEKPSEPTPAEDTGSQYTTHIDKVNGPTHTGQGDIIYLTLPEKYPKMLTEDGVGDHQEAGGDLTMSDADWKIELLRLKRERSRNAPGSMESAIREIRERRARERAEGELKEDITQAVLRELQAERVVLIGGKALQDVQEILKENAYREQDPVMLVGPFSEAGIITCILKQMYTTEAGKRLPDELHTGILKVTPDAGGVRAVFSLGNFPDSGLFWQTVGGLLAKLGVPMSTEDDTGGEKGSIEFELASFRRQLAEEKENLLLLQERESQYVLETDIPLQLVKEKRRRLGRIEELEKHIEEKRRDTRAE